MQEKYLYKTREKIYEFKNETIVRWLYFFDLIKATWLSVDEIKTDDKKSRKFYTIEQETGCTPDFCLTNIKNNYFDQDIFCMVADASIRNLEGKLFSKKKKSPGILILGDLPFIGTGGVNYNPEHYDAALNASTLSNHITGPLHFSRRYNNSPSLIVAGQGESDGFVYREYRKEIKKMEKATFERLPFSTLESSYYLLSLDESKSKYRTAEDTYRKLTNYEIACSLWEVMQEMDEYIDYAYANLKKDNSPGQPDADQLRKVMINNAFGYRKVMYYFWVMHKDIPLLTDEEKWILTAGAVGTAPKDGRTPWVERLVDIRT